MIQVCPKCGELQQPEKQHAADADCYGAMKSKLARARKVMSVARFNIQRCRDRKHHGNKVHPKLGVCSGCLSSGYSAFAVVQEILLQAEATPSPQS